MLKVDTHALKGHRRAHRNRKWQMLTEVEIVYFKNNSNILSFLWQEYIKKYTIIKEKYLFLEDISILYILF